MGCPSRNSGPAPVGYVDRDMNDVDRDLESPEEQTYRREREKRYKVEVVNESKITDADLLTATIIDSVPTGAQSPDPRGIPASSSDAVVIGTVLGAKAYLDNSKTFIYSEYQVRVDDLLKQDTACSTGTEVCVPVTLASGAQVIVSRLGGTIHFASGNSRQAAMYNEGFPAVGSQYILFLYRARTATEYSIVFRSAYELRNGRIYPLDDNANEDFNGMRADVFLEAVRKAIGGVK